MIITSRRHGLPLFLLAILAPLLLLATGTSQAGVCDNFYSSGFRLAQGKLNPPMVSRPKPAKGQRTREPNFKTCMFRATNHRTEPSDTFIRNDYSRRQAFNTSSTYFITYSHDGSWHLYNARTLKHLRRLTPLAGDAEPQWHPTNHNILYYLPTNGGTRLMKLDVRNNRSSTAVNFKGRLPSWASSAAHIWTRSEGSPSANGRYWGFLVYDADWNMLGHIVWDLQQNRLVGSRRTSAPADNGSISALGRWFVVSGSNGVWAWSADFRRKKKIDAYGGVHSDLAIGPNGHDYFVSVDYESNNGDVYFVDLDRCPSVSASASSAPECPRTVLFSMYPTGAWATFHFSGKAFKKPGWVLISSYDTQSNRGAVPWFNNKIFAVQLKASPKIHPLAYTHRVPVTSGDTTGAGNYWSEPHATVNRAFTRIAFNSNWGNSRGVDIDVYMIKLPFDVLGKTATVAMGEPLPPPAVESTAIAARASRAVSRPAASTSTEKAETVSIGCVACERLGQAGEAVAGFAGDLWNRAEPTLRSTAQSLGLAPGEPAPVGSVTTAEDAGNGNATR